MQENSSHGVPSKAPTFTFSSHRSPILHPSNLTRRGPIASDMIVPSIAERMMDDLLVDFLTETNEGLAELDVALVKLERNPADEATLSLIFRLVHTIKGTCGFLGLGRLEKVAHAAENVLGKLRDKQLPLTGDVITNVLFAIDQIKEIVTALSATGAEPPGEDSKLIATLNAISLGETVIAAPPVADAAPRR